MNYPTNQPILDNRTGWKIFHPVFKLIALTLLMFLSFQSANAQSTNAISLNFEHQPLPKVLNAIKKQSGFVFVSGDIDLKKYYINVQVQNATITQALTMCLQNHGLDFQITNKTVVITKSSAKTSKTNKESSSRFFELRGQVRSKDGLPLRGASVLVKGTYNGTSVEPDGAFSLPGVADDAVLLISFIGYEDLEVEVAGRSNIGAVQLTEKANELDEVKVLAYGITTSNRYTTGSSVKITSKDIDKQPVGNVMQALQGKVAGLVVNQMSGLHGGDINVEIRGQNSIDVVGYGSTGAANTLRNVPLYIVDGIAFPGSSINQQAASKDPSGNYNYIFGPNGNGSPLSTINPKDIESIEVLKDANATAIYGSRGANGVILITTKKGKIGKPTVSVDFNSGINITNTSMSMLNLSDYLALRKEAFANDNKTPTASNAPDLTLWSQTEAINFKKLLVPGAAKSYTGNVSVSGGSKGYTFMLSGNYSRSNSVFNDNRSSNDYGFHFSSGYTSPDEKFKATVSVMMGNSISNLAVTDLYSSGYSLPANFPLYNKDGSLYWWSKGIPNISNPLSDLNTSYDNKMSSLNTSINLRYAITPDLALSLNTGLNKTQSNQTSLSPSTASDPNSAYFSISSASVESVSQNLVFEPQINYNKVLGNGSLTALVGATYQKTTNEQPYYILASGFASDLYLSNLAMASSYTVRNGYNAYKYASIFGNVNYIYKERYILNGNFRRDGSSKFGPNNLYSNFGSVGAAWIFTGEKFFSKKPEWFSFGKIRSSYGLVGSDNAENYSFLSTYVNNSSTYYSGSNGLVPSRLANPDYQWEKSKKFELATDFGFFKDRLLLNFAYYNNRTSNQLLQYPLSTQTGFSSYTANLDATVQNSGFEITLSSTNVQMGKFTWSVSANVTLPQNKLLSFPGLSTSAYANSFVVGRSTSALYLLHYTGTDKNGKPTYQDVDNDGVISTALGSNTGYGDLVYKGKSTPDMYGGLVNTIKYKEFQLDFSLSFTFGAKSLGILSSLNSAPGNLANYPTAVVQEMRDMGLEKLFTTSTWSSDFNLLKQSDALLQNISYGKLNNVSLSYNVPEHLVRSLKIGGLRLYVQGQNLLWFTLSGKSYTGINPETGSTSVPPAITFVGGLQLSF